MSGKFIELEGGVEVPASEEPLLAGGGFSLSGDASATIRRAAVVQLMGGL
jgi:hypothetical protein